MKRHCIVIGSGIGGLAAAVRLAHRGYQVTLLEKNEQPGGRAGVFSVEGLRFDMGPSWYLMPEVFERFFQDLGENIENYLQLEQLSPSYRVYFEGREKPIDIHSSIEKDAAVFEELEPGSSKQLVRYLKRAKVQYQTILDYFLYARFDRLSSLINRGTFRALRSVPLFGTMQGYVQKFFTSDEVQKLLQYTLVFLGSSPYNAPALYNIMSHIDFSQGVFYPKGGIYQIVVALVRLADKYGVELRCNAGVSEILVSEGAANGVKLDTGEIIHADLVISNADIHHTETKLLPPAARQYSNKYWENRVMAPSTLLMYLGIKGELPTLQHHTLYFAKDWRKNFAQIFDTPSWPDEPSFYVSNPSKTDDTVAPKGTQNVFVLVPIGSGVEDTPEKRAAYTQAVLKTMSEVFKIPDLTERIVYSQLFGPNDFTDRYNSYRGSALGLAHTWSQTAFGRPSSKSKKLKNLYYVGAATHPGIGMPVCLVSAYIATDRIIKEYPCSA